MAIAGPLYFEDLPIGYESVVGSYELSAEEIVELARRWDPQPFHIDEKAAQKSVFGGLVLGIIAYHTRTIWGGVILHLGVAWGMEALAFLQRWSGRINTLY